MKVKTNKKMNYKLKDEEAVNCTFSDVNIEATELDDNQMLHVTILFNGERIDLCLATMSDKNYISAKLYTQIDTKFITSKWNWNKIIEKHKITENTL